ncbi:MAG: hypothetical protein GXP16_01935 [Gammaproteobacteria bacterium]|nr:hypothetical protein [Gammaproteobacteria bacterium]
MRREDQGWDIRLNNQSIRQYSRDQIRVSILWKAFCFKDQAAADLYADPHYNLTPQMAVDIFCQDLRGRGHNVREPSDLETDEDWRKLIVDTYGGDDFLRT